MRPRLLFDGLEEPSPPMPPHVEDLDTAEERAAHQGIDLVLFGPWTDLFGYTLDPDEGAAWARFCNEAAVEAAAARAMLPLATVPLQSPELAVRELEASRDLGCRGVMIGTRTRSGDLDAPELNAFWEAASALQLPVFLHPILLARDPRLADYGLGNAIGRANETLVSVSRLLFAGVLQRHEHLTLIVAHGGAGLLAMLPRLHRNHELAPSERADPVQGFHRLFFDSVVLDPQLLRRLVAVVGDDRVLLGSDTPFPWEPKPRETVEAAGLDPPSTELVLRGNAERLFRLED
jgi:aminocarboxymuconate-semialdehyde decarboxylase